MISKLIRLIAVPFIIGVTLCFFDWGKTVSADQLLGGRWVANSRTDLTEIIKEFSNPILARFCTAPSSAEAHVEFIADSNSTNRAVITMGRNRCVVIQARFVGIKVSGSDRTGGEAVGTFDIIAPF